MQRVVVQHLIAVAVLLLLTVSECSAQTLRVMTFNIRYNNPGDGENAWPHRKDKVASMVRLYAADIIGMQEALRGQIDDLADLLPAHDWVGVGRTDGKNSGEFTPIFYRRDRVELLENSTFWLSETPDKAGSKSWDAALPRIATWAKFKESATNREFYVVNTHFDHIGLLARRHSANLLRAKVAEVAKETPALLIGDFNCTPESQPYKSIIGAPIAGRAQEDVNTAQTIEEKTAHESGLDKNSPPPPLIDAASISRNPHHGPTTTWNGFRALVPGRMLDHIFIHGQMTVEQHAILSDHWDGKFPSDHLPVMVEINLKESE